MPAGEQLGRDGPLGNFAGSFLLFRFVYLNKEWINQWHQHAVELEIKKNNKRKALDYVCLPENTSTSMSLKEALVFSKCTSMDTNNLPVLFVFALQNYKGYAGFRLNEDKYSAYPLEEEVLLKEGFEVYVLRVETMTVQNRSHEVSELHGKNITVIHLLNMCY